MSDKFADLLAELNSASEEQTVLAKSVAAAEPVVEALNPEDELEQLAKSTAAADAAAEGEEVTLVDGDEIIKSLGMMDDRLSNTEETLTKGLRAALTLIKGQSELIKAMNTKVDALSGTGTGRKTTLSVHGKPAAGEQALVKSEQPAITKEEVLAKANTAFEGKKISGLELTVVDVSLREGKSIDQSLLSKIL